MKKKFLLIIRRGFLEFEYILPIIKKFSEKYDMCTIFLNYKSYKSLESNSYLFSKWKKLNKYFYIQKKYHFIFLKILNNVLNKIKLKILLKFKKKINYKLHNPKILINQLEINHLNEIKYIFTEYGNFSIWIKNFYQLSKRPKIIFFPSSPQIFLNKKIKRKKKLYGDLLLNISTKEKKFWKQFIDSKKIKPIGVPNFNQIRFNKRKKNDNKKTILIATSGSSSKNNCYYKYIFDNIIKLRNVRVVVKPHPFKENTELLNLISVYQKRYDNFFVSNKLIYELCKVSNVLVCNFVTSAMIYGLFLKLPIISFPFREKNELPSDNHKLGFILKINSLNNFFKKISCALDETQSDLWSKQQTNFKKYYFEKNYSNDQIVKMIELFQHEKKVEN
jgi:hypothetical protein